MGRQALFRVLASVLVIAIAIYSLGSAVVFSVVRADGVVEDFDRSKLIMLAVVAMALSDIPLDQVERYELFHTLYIYRDGSKTLVNQPYLDSDLVLNITRVATDLRSRLRSGGLNVSAVSNSTGVYIYVNQSLFLGLEYSNSSWSLWLEPLYNKTIDSNTVVYWRGIKANYSSNIASYSFIYLIKNVSETHKIYIVTVGELSPDGNSYSYVFTLANYWFKNKTVFFGDWIVLPEGADCLSQYYQMVADGVKWLSANIYKGTSPGYMKTGGKDDYQPTAYPQIANVLQALAMNVPEEVDKPVEKGYVLATDFLLSVIAGAITGAISYVVYWAITTQCDIRQWSWRDFALSVAIGAALGPVGSKITQWLGGLKVMALLPQWLRW